VLPQVVGDLVGKIKVGQGQGVNSGVGIAGPLAASDGFREFATASAPTADLHNPLA
jgi:hypothetical protein